MGHWAFGFCGGFLFSNWREFQVGDCLLFLALKVLAGVGMYWLYTSYYPDRSTADIFKYFDDSKVMFDALFEQPGDYFKMLFGIANEGAHFDESYYQQMNHWFRKWERGIYNDSHTIIRFNALVRLFSFWVLQCAHCFYVLYFPCWVNGHFQSHCTQNSG